MTLFVDFRRIEVKNDNSANIVSHIICLGVDISRKKIENSSSLSPLISALIEFGSLDADEEVSDENWIGRDKTVAALQLSIVSILTAR